jgi:hypothetical protein
MEAAGYAGKRASGQAAGRQYKSFWWNVLWGAPCPLASWRGLALSRPYAAARSYYMERGENKFYCAYQTLYIEEISGIVYLIVLKILC